MGRNSDLTSQLKNNQFEQGALVRFKTNNRTVCKEIGIVIRCLHTQSISDMLWCNDIITVDWEDLEAVK